MNQERKVIIRTLTIHDVLEGIGFIEVSGVRFDCHVTVMIRQVGSGDMEIMDANDRELYIIIPQLAYPLKLDKETFEIENKRLYEEFLRAIDLKALSIAASTPDGKWDYDEVEDDES